MPELCAGEVLAEPGVEDYLGEETVSPLAVEEVGEFACGTVLIIVGVAYGDEGRVPRSLVRVETGTWLRVVPPPVEVQHHLGLLNELLGCLLHRVSLLLKSPALVAFYPDPGSKRKRLRSSVLKPTHPTA